MPHLFDPLALRALTLRNRAGMSPMCQYSAPGGVPTYWHVQQLGGGAAGALGLVCTEATAVEPRGRISLRDTGIWNEEQAAAWRPIAALIDSLGAVPCMQLAHAGRKAGTAPPWDGGKPYGDEWVDEIVAPSSLPFDEGYRTPHELTERELTQMISKWHEATLRALDAGFKAVELHMAHGYLLHEFLSPLTNQRKDSYGGSIENRMRFPLEVAAAIRQTWPDHLPVLVRISASDWAAGGWDIEQSIVFARELKAIGIDLVDCSSGGAVPGRQMIPEARAMMALPGYQVPFAEAVRREAGIAAAAVGLISEPQQAEQIVAGEQADIVLLARELLRHPHWCFDAARELGQEVQWPKQYERAKLA